MRRRSRHSGGRDTPRSQAPQERSHRDGNPWCSWARSTVLGSTSEQVLRRTTMPPRLPFHRIGRVVRSRASSFPVDPDGMWIDELNAATAFARLYRTEIALIHVVPRALVPPWRRDGRRRPRPAARDQCTARALAPIRGVVPRDLEVISWSPPGPIRREPGTGSMIVMSVRRDPRARVGSSDAGRC